MATKGRSRRWVTAIIRRLLILLLCLAGLPACTLLQPEKAIVRGSVWLVPQREVHLAIAAARAGDPRLVTAPVSEVIVSSHTELFIWFEGSGYGYATVRRQDGRWRYVATAPERVVLVCWQTAETPVLSASPPADSRGSGR